MRLRNILPLFLLFLAFSGCSEDDSTLDPAVSDSAIIFIDMELSHFLVDTDTVSVVPGTAKSPDDIVTIPLRVSIQMQRNASNGDGALLRCTVTPDGQRNPIADESLQDRNSGLHTFEMDLELRRGDVGDYTIEVTGQEPEDGNPASALANMRVVFGNNPPVITDIAAPDTVTIQAQKITIDLSVKVEDPSGLKDIKQVFFNSYKPDGSPSKGNPFFMFDDGSLIVNGDAVAGDGWFSRRIELLPGTQPGEYDFEFRAVDYSNTTSNVVIHKMLVR